MKKQDFDIMKDYFEDFAEDKLRGLTGKNTVYYLDHYLKRFKQSGIELTDAKVLEIGCGEGKITQYLAKIFSSTHFTAIDLSENNIQIAKRNFASENIHYEVANVADDPWKPSSQYNLIYSFSVIQYFDHFSYRALQTKLLNSLAEGGQIIHMSIPDKEFFWKSCIGAGLMAPIRLAILWPFRIRDYLSNRYNNGYWWDKEVIQRISPTANIEILPSDSFYRFDVIEKL